MVCRELPIRYLCVPLHSKKLNLVNCEPLLHQIKKRLSSWTVKSLSFAGRLLVIKIVISGSTTFWCAAFILPKACIRRINSLCSVFLWKGDIESNNTARVAWEKCVLTKEQGGLGIRDLQTWNLACCIKLIWLLFFKAGSVWVAWFTDKVLKGSVHNYWTAKPSASYSWLANKLLKLKSVVFRLLSFAWKMVWLLGSGMTIGPRLEAWQQRLTSPYPDLESRTRQRWRRYSQMVLGDYHLQDRNLNYCFILSLQL